MRISEHKTEQHDIGRSHAHARSPDDQHAETAVGAGDSETQLSATVTSEAADHAEHRGRGLKLWQVISSVAAAGIGVQSSANRERDFEQGKMGTFVLAGLVFTTLFIGGVLLVVNLVLSKSGG